MQAQLGQIPSINLGGYIPAAAQHPKLWQQVLAQFLGNVATQGAGALIDSTTAPDTNRIDPNTGQVADGPFYQKKPSASDVAAIRSGEQGSRRVEQGERSLNLEQMKFGHQQDVDSSRLGLESERNEIARYDSESQDFARRAGATQGAAKVAGDIQSDQARQQYLREQLALEKEKFAQARTSDERDAAVRKLMAINQVLGTKEKSLIDQEQLSMERELLPSKKKALEAQGASREAYAEGTMEKTALGAMQRKQLQIFQVNSRKDLSPQQKQAAIDAILRGANP